MTLFVAEKDGSFCIRKEKATMCNLVAAMPFMQEEMGTEEATSSALGVGFFGGRFWLVCYFIKPREKARV